MAIPAIRKRAFPIITPKRNKSSPLDIVWIVIYRNSLRLIYD